jgi:amino acid adenylation domain-containing protein
MQQRYASPALAPSCFALDHNGPVARAFVPFAEDDLSTPVHVLFERTVLRHPHRIALDDGENRLTYEETLAAVRSLAARLGRETRNGALIGILLPTSADFSIAMLACFAAGRLFVPLDLHYPAAWIANVMEDAAVSAVIGRFDAEADALVPAGIQRIDIALRTFGDVHLDAASDSDAPAFVLFTSGSTGRPKGIVNSERNLLRRVQQYVNAAHINSDDHFLPLSSECTIAGLRERLTALLSGATLHLVDVQRAGARQILRTISERQITMMYGVPALLRSLANLDDGSAAGSLRVVRVGGDAVLWSDVALLRTWLSESCLIELGYSSTEAPIMQWFVPRDVAQEGSRVPIGYPLAGNALSIIDDAGVPVACGEVGQLVVRSPYVALGRWLNGASVRDDFPDDPDTPGARILHTGDLVRLKKDGLVELVGRKDRQLKIRGIRIEPAEIEAALRLHPNVLDAAILPRRKNEQARLIAYVTSRGTPAEELIPALKDFLKTRLASHLQPHRIHALEQIPRLPSAKLDMAALAAIDEGKIAEEEQGTTSAATDGSDLERTLTAIWCRVLDRPSVSRDDDFFDLGGDSLATLGLMFDIEEALGVELPVTMIYSAPTIASLAQAIAQHAEPEFSPLVQVKAGKGGVPLFLCHGIGGNVMELFAFGRRIESDGAVYAIQAKGLDGRSEPNRSVAEMAAYYISAIRSAQPSGPYLLGGYSSGGLVAFEMARCLEATGETTALLVLLDTQTNARQWPIRVWLAILGHRLHHHVAEFAALPLHTKPSYAWRTLISLWRRLLWRAGATDRDQPFALDTRVPEALQKVYDASLAAVAHYRPGRYDGPTALYICDERDPLMAPPERVWRNHAGLLEIFSTPGDHRSMLAGENAAQLARALSLRLAGALRPLQRDGE